MIKTKKIIQANRLSVTVEKEGQQTLLVIYKIDLNYHGRIKINLAFDINENIIPMFTAWVSVFLAQLCLAKNIDILSVCPQKYIVDIIPIMKILYSVRAYLENIPNCALPIIDIEHPIDNKNFIADYELVENRACLLWSGGLDSSLSQLLLNQNGYEVFPIHFITNEGASHNEKAAIELISSIHKIKTSIVGIDFPEFMEIAKNYSNCIGEFPHLNSIPHGRELLLIPLALAYGINNGCKYICLGHDKDSWSREVEFQGEVYPRHDTQSRIGTILMEKFINANIVPRIKIFSPIASFSEYSKFQQIMISAPNILRLCTSCFWGNWCGKCSKCVRYYTYQRSLNKSIIQFSDNPFAAEASPLTPYFYRESDNRVYLWPDIDYALFRIAEANNDSLNEWIIREYRKNISFEKRIQMMNIEKSLFIHYPNYLLPENFNSWLSSNNV